MRAPVTVKLDNPVEHGTDLITEITLKPLKAKHLKGLSLGDLENMKMDAAISLIGKLSGLADPIIGELDMADFERVMEALGSFLPSGGPTAG